MEIKDYVGALAGRGRIVAAVAIVVGFLAVVVFILQPQRYKATATVKIPTPASSTTSALAAVSQAYSDFAGALASDQVADQVATQIGVPKSAAQGHLSASRISGSSVAEVTYTGTDKDEAARIAKAGSIAALQTVVAARLAPLDQQLSLARSAYEDANDEYQQFVADSGIFNATQYFRSQQGRIINLKDELGVANANGDTASAAELQSKIDEKNASVSQDLADYQRLTSTRESALEAFQGAQQNQLTEQGLLDSIIAGGQVSVTDPTTAPRLAGLIKAVVPAVVVATGLAIAMIVLLEVVGPVRRRPSRDAEVGEDDADAPERLQEVADAKRNVGSSA